MKLWLYGTNDLLRVYHGKMYAQCQNSAQR